MPEKSRKMQDRNNDEAALFEGRHECSPLIKSDISEKLMRGKYCRNALLSLTTRETPFAKENTSDIRLLVDHDSVLGLEPRPS